MDGNYWSPVRLVEHTLTQELMAAGLHRSMNAHRAPAHMLLICVLSEQAQPRSQLVLTYQPIVRRTEGSLIRFEKKSAEASRQEPEP